MLKMADACQRAGGQASTSATRFHELHVQRHTNVTILFADIVNFTPLSSSLTASDLVKTLNDLFGRFDQIAQVSLGCNVAREICNRDSYDHIFRRINACALRFWAIAITVCPVCPFHGHSMLPIASTWACK